MLSEREDGSEERTRLTYDHLPLTLVLTLALALTLTLTLNA